jgi:hypothetical protein
MTTPADPNQSQPEDKPPSTPAQVPGGESEIGEEISLKAGATSHAGEASTAKPRQRSEQAAEGEDFGPRIGVLEELIGPTMSDQQLVDVIIQAPEEKLIPWENCKLPSLGLFYGWDSPFCQVRAMGQAAEKILATQRLAQTGQSIDYLFNECCRFPHTGQDGFDPLDLLAGDRIYLLYYLRGITHGNIYEFAVTCQRPDCQQVSTHTYDLNQLASTIHWADPSMGHEPFKVQLPYLTETTRREFWVGLRFLRGRDMNNLITTRRVRKKLFAAPAIRAGRPNSQRRPNVHAEPTIDDTLTENLQMVIDNVMGVKDRAKVSAFVARMHATDTSAVREWLRENSPGIESTITMTCPECGQEFMTELPITESFFRPTQKRGA